MIALIERWLAAITPFLTSLHRHDPIYRTQQVLAPGVPTARAALELISVHLECWSG